MRTEAECIDLIAMSQLASERATGQVIDRAFFGQWPPERTRREYGAAFKREYAKLKASQCA